MKYNQETMAGDEKHRARQKHVRIWLMCRNEGKSGDDMQCVKSHIKKASIVPKRISLVRYARKTRREKLAISIKSTANQSIDCLRV